MLYGLWTKFEWSRNKLDANYCAVCTHGNFRYQLISDPQESNKRMLINKDDTTLKNQGDSFKR